MMSSGDQKVIEAVNMGTTWLVETMMQNIKHGITDIHITHNRRVLCRDPFHLYFCINSPKITIQKNNFIKKV